MARIRGAIFMKFGLAPTTRIHFSVLKAIRFSRRVHREYWDYVKEKTISHREHRDHRGENYNQQKMVSLVSVSFFSLKLVLMFPVYPVISV
jgi:hypothetical protein